MIKIGDTNIYVGTRADSSLRSAPLLAVVTLSTTVPVASLGWGNSQPRDHPHCLAFEDGQFLSFNWVDGPARMYEWSGPSSFVRALDFSDRWHPTKSILINCDLGQSRSPTVALLYLAKRLKTISEDSFAAARADFVLIYPQYAPSGIADYVSEHWSEIN